MGLLVPLFMGVMSLLLFQVIGTCIHSLKPTHSDTENGLHILAFLKCHKTPKSTATHTCTYHLFTFSESLEVLRQDRDEGRRSCIVMSPFNNTGEKICDVTDPFNHSKNVPDESLIGKKASMREYWSSGFLTSSRRTRPV